MLTPTRRIAAAVTLALLAAACSNSGDDAATGATNPPSTPSTGAAGAASGSTDEFVPLDVPGVTDSEIRFASFGTNSNNPLGTCVLDCFDAGVEAYFAFRNSEGGIYGRQLVLADELDDELSNNQVRALEIVSADEAFGAFSAAQLASGYADMADAGIPLYTWAINFDEMAGRDSIFGNSAVVCGTCSSRIEVDAGTIVGATRVGVVGYGISQNSKDCVAAKERSLRMYGDQTGQELAYSDDNLAFGLPNGVAPEVNQMKRAGVDFIVSCIDLNGMKTFAQELERQGMGDVPMLHANTYNAQFVADAGDLFEGDLVMVQFRPFEATTEGTPLADFLQWMQQTGGEVSELAVQGWINADLAYQGLVAAGPNFDRASVIAATNQLTAFSAGGLISPIDWSRQHIPATEEDPATNGYAQECMAFVQVRDGAFTLVGDPAKPFFCWDNATRDWSEPVPTSFD